MKLSKKEIRSVFVVNCEWQLTRSGTAIAYRCFALQASRAFSVNIKLFEKGDMEEQHNKSIDIKTVLAWCGAIAVFCLGVGWVVGRAYMGDELAQYEKAKNWKMPEAIIKMTSLSITLDQKLNKINDYELLTKKIKQSLLVINDLEKQILTRNSLYKRLTLESEDARKSHDIKMTQKDNDIERLNELISSLEGEIITIPEGQALSVGHKSIKVGVTTAVARGSNWASVNSHDFKNSTMRVGDSFIRNVGDSKYVITLVKISEDSAGFSYEMSTK